MILVEVDLGYKIPATNTIEIVEKELMLKGELDIVIKPATIPTINQVTVVDC